MNIQFGTGVLIGIPNAGNTAANPTPTQIGILQEASVEFKSDLKKLFGNNQFPIAKARGKTEVTGKAKLALLDPAMLNQLYFGQTESTGVKRLAYNEAGTVPSPSGPYTITVTHSANFGTDYGVIDASTGLNMVKVSSAPTTGQYSVAAGVYTFAAADSGKNVLISYTWTDSANGVTIALTNQLMGYAPEFQMLLYNAFRTKYFAVEFSSCTMGSLSLPTKQEDFWIMDISFDCGVDASGSLGHLYADI